METLKFIVKGQHIKKSPEFMFNKLVAGTKNYYAAQFDMDEAWNGYSCLAQYDANGITDYKPIKNGFADIPESILEYKTFYISIIGQNENSRLTTDKTIVRQIGGK